MKKLAFTFIIAFGILFHGCQVAEQVLQMANFTKCQFRIGSVENIKLAGINVQKIQNLNQINTLDIINLTSAFASGSLPLNLTLNIEVKNPNTAQAAMNTLEWIFLIDQNELIRGVVNQQVRVAPNGGIANLPLHINVDLKKVLTGQTANSLINLALNLADASNKPTRISLKLKPSIMIGNYSINYPGYLTIKKEFVSQ